MRIGLVIYNSLDSISGGYLYDRQLVGLLRNAGDVVELISLPWRSYGRRLLHNLRPTLERRLRYGRYDILLQDELNHPSLFLVNERLRQQSSVPIISIVHHLHSSERYPPNTLATYRRVEYRYLRTVDGFIFNSETTRIATESLMKRTRPNTVCHPAADHIDVSLSEAQIIERTRRNGPLRLIFVGNVIPRKGLHTLLAALARLPGEACCLSIVGDRSLAPSYTRRLQNRTRKSANITWHGRLANDALWQLMAGSDLVVVPSSYEGFGIVYLEGMALGLPAIATTHGAAGEIVTDGENGFLIAPEDELELALRIQVLQRERDLLTRMSVAAYRYSQDFPTWAASMSNARRFLLRMLR